ncbi:MAG: hypothetical protein KC656_36875, partial [Myxococcales bacterium]|nr:hypothetical protein [Myxococcales bacterium]
MSTSITLSCSTDTCIVIGKESSGILCPATRLGPLESAAECSCRRGVCPYAAGVPMDLPIADAFEA